MITNNITGKTIQMYVDSQAAIKALDNYIITDKSVYNCKTSINKLAQDNKVCINWIPGHQGHMGNEVADRLAKRGCDMPHTDTQNVHAPHTHIKSLIKKWSQKTHKDKWKEDPEEYKQTKMFLPDTDNSIWKKIENQSIKRIRLTTQIITGHATVRKHLFKMKIGNSPLCPKCEEEDETVMHIFCKCPFFMGERHNFFGKFFLQKEELKNLKLSKILKFAEKTKRFEHET